MQAVREPITQEIHDFRCLVVNPVFAHLFGQKRENLMGTTILKKMFNQLTPTLFDSLVQIVETGEPIEQEFYWEKYDDQILYYLSAVKFGDGCSITVRDITMFKRKDSGQKKFSVKSW
ncbi:PAS domain-containing protein [Lyngbya sp. CCAP 1446/10]|uniref:PAS domain-containing protein n=1 Tax=Lyngbya sp. CCAP 1446/10 TaxID=439293 RepID=UPI002238809B|nr:PAS domain-containing protein [Lyngbya sp. CCAP 1446/10]MCW6053613.1 PAS domain-containing protein [Lyngbya sp. CCAP 1446/10]